MSQEKDCFSPVQQSSVSSFIASVILLLVPVNHWRWCLLAKLKIYPPLWYTRRKIHKSFLQRLGREPRYQHGGFNDKLQYLKLFYRPQICVQLADKFAVRQYLEEKGLEDYLVPLYAVYEHPEEIDYDALPNEFVIKVTHDSGGVFLVDDKSKLDVASVHKKLNKHLSRPYINGVKNGEWQYLTIKPQIVVEALLKNTEGEAANTDLRDYKLHCFDGRVEWIHVDIDRHSQHKRDFFTPDWQRQEGLGIKYPNSDVEVAKPEALKSMLKVAEQLAQGFPYCRVDFYEVQGKPYFGEITFHHENGMGAFSSDEWDNIFGEKINCESFYRD